MIAKNELRIGNKLQKETGEIFTVLRLDNTNDVLVEEQRGLLSLGYNLFGIHLTPEILEKCGWVWNEECKSFEGKDVRMNLEFREANSSYTMFNYILRAKIADKIFYLHQLQNLYYALTGEELNYQP